MGWSWGRNAARRSAAPRGCARSGESRRARSRRREARRGVKTLLRRSSVDSTCCSPPFRSPRHDGCWSAFSVSVAAESFLLPREFVFRGAPDQRWYRDLRWWAAIAATLPYVVIHALLRSTARSRAKPRSARSVPPSCRARESAPPPCCWAGFILVLACGSPGRRLVQRRRHRSRVRSLASALAFAGVGAFFLRLARRLGRARAARYGSRDRRDDAGASDCVRGLRLGEAAARRVFRGAEAVRRAARPARAPARLEALVSTADGRSASPRTATATTKRACSSSSGCWVTLGSIAAGGTNDRTGSSVGPIAVEGSPLPARLDLDACEAHLTALVGHAPCSDFASARQGTSISSSLFDPVLMRAAIGSWLPLLEREG